MAGSSDRKIYLRNEVLWYPQGAFDTSTGSSDLDQDLNAMNAASASLQRSVEALDQRFIDIGFDATLSGYSNVSVPLLGYDGSVGVLDEVSDFLPFIWNTSNGDTVPTDSNKVTRIGLEASATSPFKMLLKGRPVKIVSTVFVTLVDVTGGFGISSTDISGPGVPGTDFFVYVVAKESTSGLFTLKAYFRPVPFQDPTTFVASDETLIFTLRWAYFRYIGNFFREENGVGDASGQSGALGQLYVNDLRDYRHPEKTHPQLYDPPGAVRLWKPRTAEEFNLHLVLVGSGVADGRTWADNGTWIGRTGSLWEGWRVLDGHLADVNMTGRYPKGWDVTDPTDGALNQTFAQDGTNTDVPNTTVAIDTDGNQAGTAASGTHTHPLNSLFVANPVNNHTFVYLVKD